MRILFDQGTPEPLIPFLKGHTVTTAKDVGWERLVNGELLKAAETAGFEMLVTTDKNMVSQQNLKSRTIAIVVRVHPSACIRQQGKSQRRSAGR